MLISHPRGSVFWIRTTLSTKTNVQTGPRPVIVVSNDKNNAHSGVVTIVPVTSQTKPPLPMHVVIPAINGDNTNNIVLCEQITTVAKDSLTDYKGLIDTETLKHIDQALMIHLGLKPTIIQTEPVKTETKPEEKSVPNKSTYSLEFKKQYVADSRRMTNSQLGAKYGISPKTASARKINWAREITKK